MKITIPALVAAAFAVPALAQDAATDYSTVTCADFMAMDEAGMQAAFEGMGAAMPSGEAANADATASGAAATDAAAADATAATDAGAADASGATAPGDTTAQMTALRDACTADPSMMAMDAMTQAMGGAGAAGTEAATGAESSGG